MASKSYFHVSLCAVFLFSVATSEVDQSTFWRGHHGGFHKFGQGHGALKSYFGVLAGQKQFHEQSLPAGSLKFGLANLFSDVQGTGDPHFTGADNSHFDFSGVPNNTYCLISDSHLHINAYFGGYYGEYEGNPHKSLTWMRKIGILWGHHSLLLEAREGPEWQYGDGYMAAIELDGEKVVLSQSGASFSLPDESVAIKWEESKQRSGDDAIDVFSVEIKDILKLKMNLRPEVANLRTVTDGTVHFDLFFPEVHLSENVHGVLGQTFRPDHADRLSHQELVFNDLLQKSVVPGDNGEGFLDGEVSHYKSSAILAPDCQVSRFTRAQTLDQETALAMELSVGGAPAVLGNSGLPRKMLSATAAA